MKTRRRRSTPSRESSAAVSAATATLMSSRSGAGGAGSKSLAAGTDSVPADASESGAAAPSTFATAASNAPSSSGGGRESRSKSKIHGSQTASESHADHGHGHGHGEVQIISAVSPAASSDDKKISQGEMPSKKMRHATHPRRHGEKNTITSSPANNSNHKQKHPPKQPSHPSEHQELEPAGTATTTTTPALKKIPKKPSRPPSTKQTPLPAIRQTPDPTRAEPPALPHRPLVLLGQKPRGLYECDYCRTDLTRVPRIRCATCPDFDLCLDCFATSDHERIGREKRAWVDGKLGLLGADGVRDGREGGGGSDELGTYVHGEWIPFFRHRPDHGYVVADSARFALFPSFRGVRAVPVVAEDDCKDEGERRAQVVGEESDMGDGNGGNVSAAEEKNNQTNEAIDINEKENNIITETGVSDRNLKVESMEVENEDMSSEKTSKTAKGEDPKKTEDKSESNVDPSHSKEEATPTADSIPCDTEDVKGSDDSDDDESPKTNQTPKPKFEYRLLHEPKQSPHHAGNHATSWTAEEDLRLLDAILTCGLGNWPDIADHVSGGGSGSGSGSGGGDGNGAGGDGTAPSSSSGATGSASSTLGVKTEKKCMERYLDDFLGRYGHILPPYTLVPLPLEDPSDMNVAADDGRGTDAATAIDTISTTANDRKRRRRQPDDDDDASYSAHKKQKYRVLPTDQLEGYDAIWPDPYIPPNWGVKRGDPVGRDLWYKSEQDYIKTLSKAVSKIDAERIKAEFLERRAKNMAGYEAKVLPPRMDDIRTMPGCELAGYMPRRGDFDMEWDNDAEKMIADMEFSSDDSPEDQELKLEVIRIFNTKLDERERRKKFILDRKLLNYREHQAKMWALPPDERHLVHRMRMFARFHSREEHEAFVQKILEAKRLRKEIAKLQMYRRMGIRSSADAEKFELDKMRREYHIAEWQKKEAEKKKAEADAARAAKENAEGAIVMKSGGVVAEKILGSSANQSMSLWRQYKSIESVRKSRRGTDSRDFDASEVEIKSPERSTQTQSNTDAANLGIESKDSQKFVIKDKPGYELLSSKEIALCKRLKLLPRDYLNVKKALLSGALTGGLYNSKLSKSKGTLAIVDITQRDNVIDFVLRAGWIPSRPTLTD